jgi:hypothetical protein
MKAFGNGARSSALRLARTAEEGGEASVAQGVAYRGLELTKEAQGEGRGREILHEGAMGGKL